MWYQNLANLLVVDSGYKYEHCFASRTGGGGGECGFLGARLNGSDTRIFEVV